MKYRFSIVFWFTVLQLAYADLAIAKTQGSALDGLIAQFPYLERALVIATSINLVIVIFVLLLYLAKRKMSKFSPTPLARIQQKQK